MKRAEYALAGRLGRGCAEQVAVPFFLTLERSTAANVGRILVDFDTEVRRTTLYRLSTSKVLPRNSQYMEVIHTRYDEELHIELALSNDLRVALISQPIEFLLTLDWFWDFRYSQSRVRSPIGRRNPHERWRRIFSSVSECAEFREPVAATIAIGDRGATSFSFRSERALL